MDKRSATSQGSGDSATWILSNIGTLYDGTQADHSALRHNVDLIIKGNRIEELRPHQPPAAEGGPLRVNCQGHTVTPGLIDCHSHVTVLGVSDADITKVTGAETLLWVERILWATLVDGGVTTLRDVGGATDHMKRLVDQGVIIGPRLKIAICMLSTTGGHADFRGPDRCHASVSTLWGPAPGRPDNVVDGPWECRKRVREIAACGADLIKICASPGVISPTDHLEHQDFSAEEIAAIVSEAETRGLRVAAHAHSKTGIEMAIENGVHDLQHISFMDERLVEMAAKKGCTVTPTSWITRSLPNADGLSPFVMSKVQKVAEVHQQAVEFASSGDLKILAGTDPVLPGMHGRNWRELSALVADGLCPMRAWHGMTGLAASELGVDDTGTLAVGQRADLLICDQDVVADPGAFETGALLEVVKDGQTHRGAFKGAPSATFAGRTRAQLGL